MSGKPQAVAPLASECQWSRRTRPHLPLSTHSCKDRLRCLPALHIHTTRELSDTLGRLLKAKPTLFQMITYTQQMEPTRMGKNQM